MENENSENIEVIGKDEMNLCEYPMSVITRKPKAGKRVLKHSEEKELPNGKKLLMKWVIEGSPEHGLPTPFDNGVYLALLYLWKQQGCENPLVSFTRFQLCQVMGLKPGGSSYQNILNALRRLTSMRVEAENTFWDKKNKKYPLVNFGLIDSFILYTEKDDKTKSFVRFSDTLYNSLMAGYIKNIDLTLYFSLKNPVARQLFRYLDKKRLGKYQFEISLCKLAYNHLGFDRDIHKKASKIKRSLEPAHKELIDCGFLGAIEYTPMKNTRYEKIVYKFQQQKKLKGIDTPLVRDMVEVGVTEAVARQVIKEYPECRIRSQIEALPYRKAENPAAVLMASIKGNWTIPKTIADEYKQEMQSVAVQKEEEEKKAHREQVKAYIKSLSKEEDEELTKRAIELAWKEGRKIFRKKINIPDHIINGYKHVLTEQKLKGDEVGQSEPCKDKIDFVEMGL